MKVDMLEVELNRDYLRKATVRQSFSVFNLYKCDSGRDRDVTE